jgi:hypothetical protein
MEPLGPEVRRELSRFGPAAGMAQIVEAWPGCVGAAVARNAWPARIARDGTLHVATASSAWAFELAQLEPTVRQRLGAALAEDAPPRLRFAPGPLAEPAPAPVDPARDAPPEPAEEDRAAARRAATAIDDDELRALVERAAAASLARGRSSRGVW